MIALALPLALQAAPADAAAAVPMPSLDMFGWELVYEEGGEFPAAQYIAPESIRPLAEAEGQFMVTTSAQWVDGNDQWRTSPTGLVIDCRQRTWRGDWMSFGEAGQNVIAYLQNEQPRKPSAKSPMGAVIDRVCGVK